ILGVNVTRPQVDRAARRIQAEGLSDHVAYSQASAVALPVASGTMNRVLALECAFHFPLREDFFREAFRVLKPGGLLAAADIVAAPDLHDGVGPRDLVRRGLIVAGRRFWHIPKENLYSAAVYRRKLEAAGFVDIEMRDISADTLPGIVHVMRQTSVANRFPWWERGLWLAMAESFALAHRRRWIDYILVRAVKPRDGRRSVALT
ncbi:MAG: class I SAM-dependent methyltransferase, partial [Dehalococcoidia bacterium]|nr:class I SAM-dependent methyltransferase [Dehalococcoidia bacterium]